MDEERLPLEAEGLEAALAEIARHSARAAALDERLELVLAASKTGIWEWDVATGRLDWSEQILRLHGLLPGEEPPDFEAYVRMIHPDDRERFMSEVQAAVANRAPYSLEFRIVWRDGTVHWTHGAGRTFYDAEGRPVRMIGTGQDIDERKRLEEVERRANEWRQAFVEVISHELRTPIATILGTAALLERPRGIADETTRDELVREIAVDAERLERLVEDLVVLSRAERGSLDASREPVELRRLVTRVVADERRRAPDATFEVELPDDLPVASGDETAIEQVLRNLLANAVKYSGPTARVRTAVSAEDDALVVRVVDDGPGLLDADPHRVFELFYRAPSQLGRASGSGIGLYVCARLVEAMGGRITCGDGNGGGAEFLFAIPRAEEGLDEPDELGRAPGADSERDPGLAAAAS